MTAGTTAPEWAEVTAGCRFAWQRSAAAIEAWIAAGELPPGPLPPATALAAELGDGLSAVMHALTDLAGRGVVHRIRSRYHARPLPAAGLPRMPGRVTLAGVAAQWGDRYAVGEPAGARDPFRARPLHGAARMLTGCTPGLLGVLIAADWAGTQ